MCEIWSHMQWKQGRNRLVVTDCVAHVAPVRMLCDFSRPTQPWGETPLQCCIVGRNGGAGTTKAPEYSICPGRFPLLGTDRRQAKMERLPHTVKINGAALSFGWLLDEPGVICMGAHVKLISRWEFELSLIEPFQDGLCAFCHVELWSTEGDVCILCATPPSAGRGWWMISQKEIFLFEMWDEFF